MSFYLIGLGLDLKSISLEALEICRRADKVYIENYTAEIPYDIMNLEKIIGKRIFLLTRIMVENEKFVEEAKNKNIVLLTYGSPLIATTHISIILKCRKENISYKILHNSSIFDAITETGLQIYKFGKTASIPFQKDVVSPYNVLNDNQKLGLHTLFLLDLKDNKFLSINEAIDYLLKTESKEKRGIFSEDTLCIGCCQIGSAEEIIKSGKARDLLKLRFSKFPQCLIVPGKLHFMEEEVLDFYKI